jgi:hypothetical protein
MTTKFYKKLFSHSSFQLHRKVLISAIVEDVHVFMQAAVAYLSQSTKVVKTNGTQILFPNHYFLSHVIFNTIKQMQSIHSEFVRYYYCLADHNMNHRLQITINKLLYINFNHPEIRVFMPHYQRLGSHIVFRRLLIVRNCNLHLYTFRGHVLTRGDCTTVKKMQCLVSCST